MQPTIASAQVSAERHEMIYCLLLSTCITRNVAATYKYLKKTHSFLYLRTYRLLITVNTLEQLIKILPCNFLSSLDYKNPHIIKHRNNIISIK